MGISKLFSSTKLLGRVKQCRLGVRCASNASPEVTVAPCDEPGSHDKKLDKDKKGLVLGVYECNNKFELTPAAEQVNQKSGGKLCQYLNELSSELKLGKAFVVTELVEDYSAVAIASLGSKNAGYNKLEELDEKKENVRWGVGAGVRSLQARGCGRVAVEAAGEPDAAAEAATLAAWRFQEFKSCGDRVVESEVSLYPGLKGAKGEGEGEGEGNEAATLWREGAVRARAQNWARYLSDMPANKMAPVDLAQAALDVLCPLGVRVIVHDADWVAAQGMQALLAVARGSCEPPVMLEVVYNGAPGQPNVLIAAKGITFDSGGLCLKPGPAMMENRGSMAGAAVTLATFQALATLKVPINVTAVIPLCENMISGQCMKVGDVVTALNGLSIQIEDTDLEGRLALADALVYGQAVARPALVFVVATLTHGVLQAMGGGAFGCFSSSEAAWGAVRGAGARSGDRPWRLPLWDYYRRQLTDDTAVDLRNKGSGKAAPCIGAAFLRHFVCGDWVHMDVTGVGKLGHAPAPPYLDARRMTGRPTRTLLLALQDVATASQDLARKGRAGASR